MSGRKIKGRIIHHCRDEYGEIFVADDGMTRSLYFGDVQQSSIRLDRPEILVDDYSQAMMSVLALRPEPKSVLLIGLGGCALVHFLLHACPSCELHVVEIRRTVMDVASEFFSLPARGNLHVHHAPGQEFIVRTGSPGTYDLILSDAFDEGGPATGLMGPEFLSACRKQLGTAGIFVANLWTRPKDGFPARCDYLKEILGGPILRLVPGEVHANGLVFWAADPNVFQNLPSYRPAARRLHAEHRINFPRYLMLLYRQNISRQAEQ